MRACARDAASPHSGLPRAPETPNLRTKASTTPRKVKSPLPVSERAQTVATHPPPTERPDIAPLAAAPPPRCRCQPPQAAWRRRAPPNRPPKIPLPHPPMPAGPPRPTCSARTTWLGQASDGALWALRSTGVRPWVTAASPSCCRCAARRQPRRRRQPGAHCYM